jgi:hypothetical protein
VTSNDGRTAERQRQSMHKPRHLIQLRVHELSAYRAAVIACAGQTERGNAERLLGQIASLEAQRQGDGRLQFVPAATSAALASRALAHLRGNANP